MPERPPQNPDQSWKATYEEGLSRLVASGAPLQDISKILNIPIITVSSRGSTYRTLDLAGFLGREMKKPTNERIALPSECIYVENTILPPDIQEIKRGDGSGEFLQPEYIPRTEYTMQVLRSLKLKYGMITGKNEPGMVRQLSYTTFVLPVQRKIIFVNNEGGNSTYIVHFYKKESGETWKTFAAMKKSELRSLEAIGLTSHIDWDPNIETWKGLLAEEIQKVFVSQKTETHSSDKTEESSKVLAPTVPAQEVTSVATIGWLTRNALVEKTGIDEKTLGRILGRYHETHPEWFRKFRIPSNNQLALHLHPDLVQLITEEVNLVTVAPEGWVTFNQLTAVLKIKPKFIKPIVEQLRISNPDWFKILKKPESLKGSGIKAEHLHPELVTAVANAIKQIPTETLNDTPVEEVAGWTLFSDLAEKLAVDRSTITAIIEREQSRDGNLVKKVFKRGKLVTYIHPDLVLLVTNEINSIKEAPKNWLTINELAQKLSSSWPTINSLIEKYRVSNPDWFKIYRKPKGFKSAGRKLEFLSPALIVQISKELKELEPAPPLWITKMQLVKRLKIRHEKVTAMLEQFKKINPAWFKVYKMPIKTGHAAIFLHPDLVELVTKKINSGERP